MAAGAPDGGDAAGLRELVRERGLLGGERPVLVMLSGGRDSVCLLDVAVALRTCQAVSAVHVNYGLRDQADEEERHCARLCQRLGVQLQVVRKRRQPRRRGGLRAAGVDEQAATAQTPGNLQAWAREVRYRAAAAIARERDELIATGHTASDQVETILYRLAASPGRRALLGMSASDTIEGGRALVRPLLELTRERTTAYCRERGLTWCDDESNDSPSYARARVRHGLVPALRAVHPAAEANVLRTARLLRDEAELLDSLVAQELGGAEQIALERLEQLPAPLARLVVVHLAERAAGTYVPQAGGRVGELLALGRRGGRAELHLGAGAGAVIDEGRLRIVKLAPGEHS